MYINIKIIKIKKKMKINLSSLSFLVFITFILASQFISAEDWPMFHHDSEHTGETSDVIEHPENLGVVWKFKTSDRV